MPHRPAPGSRFPCRPGAAAVLLSFALAGCAAPATTSAGPTPAATLPPTPATTSTATTAPPTPTKPPSPTRTATETPAVLTISPATLAQLRPLWVLEEPGNPDAQIGCQDMACWTVSRLGGYAFSPDGATLAVGVCTVDSTENTTNPRHYRFNCDGPAEVRLYDSAGGDLRQALTVGDFPLSIAFHPAGNLLAAGMAHRSIEIWDLEAGEKVQTLLHSTTHTGVEKLAFSPDGGLLVSDGDDLLQLWDWERGLPAGTIEGASAFVLSPSGDRLATLTWTRNEYVEARFYPLDDLGAFRAFRLDWSKHPSRIAYRPDGSALIAIGFEELELVDPHSGVIVREAESADLLRSGPWAGYPRTTAAQTADGRLLITATLQDAAGDYRDGLGLWDPTSDGAHTWLSDPLELDPLGETYFSGFDRSPLTLAPGDRFLIAADPFTGALWVWGLDPLAPAEGVVCLGTCGA